MGGYANLNGILPYWIFTLNGESILWNLHWGQVVWCGRNHLWQSLDNTVGDVRKGITKARLVTGTYLLQVNKHKFSPYTVDPVCPMCRLEPEDAAHMLLRCPSLHTIRQEVYTPVLHKVESSLGAMSYHHSQRLISCSWYWTVLLFNRQFQMAQYLTSKGLPAPCATNYTWKGPKFRRKWWLPTRQTKPGARYNLQIDLLQIQTLPALRGAPYLVENTEEKKVKRDYNTEARDGTAQSNPGSVKNKFILFSSGKSWSFVFSQSAWRHAVICSHVFGG